MSSESGDGDARAPTRCARRSRRRAWRQRTAPRPGARQRGRDRGLPLSRVARRRDAATALRWRCARASRARARARAMANARGVRVGGASTSRPAGDHRDAVDRAGRDAQLAAGAQRRQDRVHALLRADDRVDRAGRDAQRAADARGLVDDGHEQRPVRAARGVERLRRAAGQRGELGDHGLAARRTAIDVALAARERVRIRLAAREAAPRALRLRQHARRCAWQGCPRARSSCAFYRATRQCVGLGRGYQRIRAPTVSRARRQGWKGRGDRRRPLTRMIRAPILRVALPGHA